MAGYFPVAHRAAFYKSARHQELPAHLPGACAVFPAVIEGAIRPGGGGLWRGGGGGGGRGGGRLRSGGGGGGGNRDYNRQGEIKRGRGGGDIKGADAEIGL